MIGDSLEGPLYVEIAKVWEEAFCMISTDGADKIFQAFKKVRVDVPASKSNKSNQILLEVREYISIYYRFLHIHIISIISIYPVYHVYLYLSIMSIYVSMYLSYLSIYSTPSLS